MPRDTIEARVAATLGAMTPEEKVGQLFLVSFNGPSAAPESEIYQLITQYHVGGVILRAASDNFVPAPDTAAGALDLTNTLQQVEYDHASAPLPTVSPESSDVSQPEYVPLFITLAHEGDGPSYTQIHEGLTPLPNAMAIGATWNPDQARTVGEIVGRELSALGVNMLLGPSLDVLEIPKGAGDPGTRTFGGDSYWVGLMGRHYIRGIHAGSRDQMLVVARNFPGQGGSDRDINDEVPTVRKTLDQLQLIELAPFFAVTGNASDPAETADGLLVTHIRYQGFQGNIRDTTRPVSLDQPALQDQLLKLPELAAWREQGGLLVSESLGVRGVRRFIDPTERTFPARLVARDALLAGNDVLQTTDFAAPGLTQFQTLVDTLTFFAQKYGEDEVFARRVDEAAGRILNAKLGLYGDFSLGRVTRPADGLEGLGQGRDQIGQIAAEAATLISPSLAELDARLPNPPNRSERIVFFTDTRVAAQCSTCPEVPMLGVDAMQQAVLRFYGPQAAGQVSAARIESFTFSELAGYLQSPEPANSAEGTAVPNPVEGALEGADWIVFAMLDVDPSVPGSDVVRTFLSNRLDLARQKNVVVFAFGAPYYLDATEIGKLAAYYGLYSKRQPFVDLAARLLFREARPAGASPVSIAGVGYNILETTAPDPSQVIPICIGPTESACEVTTELPSVKVGDVLPLHTGTILDYNGNPVPDNTPVTFTVKFLSESIPDLAIATRTRDGVASATYPLDRTGLLEIRAASNLAQNSWTLQVNAQSDQATIISITPTPEPTTVPEPTATSAGSPEPTPASPPATIGPINAPTVNFGDFWLMVIGSLMLGMLGFYVGHRNALSRTFRMRLALWGIIGAALGYNYFVLGFPGAVWIDFAFEGRSSVLVVMLGGLSGIGAGWLWWKRAGEPR